MNDTSNDWVSEIGKPWGDDIRRMAAALTAPFTRENTTEEEAKEAWEDAGEAEAWTGSPEQWATALQALNDNKKSSAWGDRYDQAREAIEQDALSIEVRSGWCGLGEEMSPEEFLILLCTGGPTCRIMGTLNQYGEPDRAWLEVQDWGKPWTEYLGENPSGLAEACLAYARVFCWEVNR